MNGRASGPVLQPVFLVILAYSAAATIRHDSTVMYGATFMRGAKVMHGATVIRGATIGPFLTSTDPC